MRSAQTIGFRQSCRPRDAGLCWPAKQARSEKPDRNTRRGSILQDAPDFWMVRASGAGIARIALASTAGRPRWTIATKASSHPPPDVRPSPRATAAMIRYALTIFLSAFLLFQVQPLVGKYILPWFGGTPSVWTTCMLMFQVLLLFGYAYAHGLAAWLRPRQQAIVHLIVLAVSLACLPITPDASWKPTGSEAPTWRILALLATTIGLPYFALSSTTPLVQSWFSRAAPGRSPYRLYALSNAGSLLALLSYPFVVEPAWSLATQAWAWSLAYLGFVALCGWCASSLMARRASRRKCSPARRPLPKMNGPPMNRRWSCGCCCRHAARPCCWRRPTRCVRKWPWCRSCGSCRWLFTCCRSFFASKASAGIAAKYLACCWRAVSWARFMRSIRAPCCRSGCR